MSPSPTDLARIRNVVAQRRKLALEISSDEEKLKAKSRKLRELDMVTLPTLFSDAQIDSIGLPADGNEPAVRATLEDFYAANIAASWTPEAREAAFAKLKELGMEPLIRRVIEVALDPEDDTHQWLEEFLEEHGYDFSTRMSVHHVSLTAAIRAMYEKGGRLSAEDQQTLGATIGQIVKVKKELT